VASLFKKVISGLVHRPGRARSAALEEEKPAAERSDGRRQGEVTGLLLAASGR